MLPELIKNVPSSPCADRICAPCRFDARPSSKVIVTTVCPGATGIGSTGGVGSTGLGRALTGSVGLGGWTTGAGGVRSSMPQEHSSTASAAMTLARRKALDLQPRRHRVDDLVQAGQRRNPST